MPERVAMPHKRLVPDAFLKPCTAICYLGPGVENQTGVPA
jgi:hypothetical protein